MTATVAHFEELLNTVPPRLVDLSEDAVAHKPGTGSLVEERDSSAT